MQRGLSQKYRVGCDVGGTFTDGVIMDDTSGNFHITKIPSTPGDPSVGFLDCVKRLLQLSNAHSEEIDYVFHGTTVATNAILEHKVAKTVLITNKNFVDVLEIGMQERPELYDLQQEKPEPLVPGKWRLGLSCRINSEGEVVEQISEEEAKQILKVLERDKIMSIAICFLHSYLNPDHEKRVAQVIEKTYPKVYISLSSDICPVLGEYARTSTTVVNACLVPIVNRYLNRIQQRLRRIGISSSIYIIESSGGVVDSTTARVRPVHIVESGPAAGVIGGTHIGELAGFKNVICFDMGGTTAKVALVNNGTPEISPEYVVGETARAGWHETGSGYLVKLPVLDLIEIGAGGGSIASVDKGGALKVGPESAGADPGPACYGRGGVEPTITDANVVLGTINPDYFVGGEMRLDVQASREAIKRKIADPLHMDVPQAARGIIEVSNSNMLRALRMASTMRGYDPKEYAMIAFGGAGPMCAGELAEGLKIPWVIIPLSPGVTTALGALLTDFRYNYVQSLVEPMDNLDLDRRINQVYQQLETRAHRDIKLTRISQFLLSRTMDLRYIGQAYEVVVPVGNGRIEKGEIEKVKLAFHQSHARLYGHSAPDEPVEAVNLRVSTVGVVNKPKFKKIDKESGSKKSGGAIKSKRKVYFEKYSGFVDCPIYDRYKLRAGDHIDGPAVIEEVDSTTVLYPGHEARTDEWGNLIMSTNERG